MTVEVDVLVAGGGIAGLSAGLGAARLGRSVQIVTGMALGGHLLSIEKIEGYPGYPEGVAGYELCPATQGAAAEAGAEFAMADIESLSPADGKWRVATEDEEYLAGAVILATGTSLRELGVPGEEALQGKGVSHCASCDAPLLRDKPVVVIGGGDSACQEALTLSGPTSKVTMLIRGDALTAQKSFLERVEADPKIEIRTGVTVEEILGDTVVTGVRLSGGETLEAEGVFVFVGLAANAAFVPPEVARDAGGRLVVDAGLRTVLPGLFVAGTLRSGTPGRAVAAAGDGALAAVGADRYLADGAWQ